ncbi:MAG: HEAT repeat domain-containing protein [Xenococcaceae cyanobacterium]
MEHSPLERLPEQANLDSKTILERATIAANSQNWILVNQNLQRLPIGKENPKLAVIAPAELEQAIDLAWQVLLLGNFQHRWQVTNFLSKSIQACLKQDERIARAIAILENEEIEVELRWFVGRILGEFDDSAAVIALINLMQSTEEEELAKMASEALSNIGIAAIESLSKLLEDEHSRLLATRSLASIRKLETIEPLLAVSKDTSPEIRAIAIEALSTFNNSRIDTLLIEALTDTAAMVRKEAVIALGIRKELSDCLNLTEKIQPLLYDLNLEVCRHAAIALGRIGSESALSALFEVLKSPLTPIELQIDSVRALSWSESNKTLDYLQEILNFSSGIVSQEIVTVLGRGVPLNLKGKATQILVDYLHSKQATTAFPEVKKALAMSLGELKENDAIVCLKELAEDKETTVRLHAIAALKKIENNDVAN